MPVAMFAPAVLVASCVIIPVPTPEHGTASSRAFIEEEEIAQIQPGKTSREEVLLRYGAPDDTRENQQLFIYSWDRIAMVVMVVAPGGGGEDFPLGREHILFIEFDEDNIVRRVALKQGMSTNKESALREFEADRPR